MTYMRCRMAMRRAVPAKAAVDGERRSIMRRAFALLLLLAAFGPLQAAQIKVFLGPTISSYAGRWPSDVFPGSGASARLRSLCFLLGYQM